MTEVDPQALTAVQWSEVSTTLTYLWMFFLAIVPAALLFLTAHAVIPSLATTNHISARAQRVRPAVYALAVLAFLAAAWAILNFASASEVLRTLYPKVWS